jgi:hypothetical protein
MADKINKIKKIKVGKVVSPVAKPARNVLRVSDPNDKRLKMYEDSVEATGRANVTNAYIGRMEKMPMEKKRIEALKGFTTPSESKEAIARLEKANKKPYKEGLDKSMTTRLEAPEGFGFGREQGYKPVLDPDGNLKKERNLLGLNVLTPKREVIYEKPPEKPKPKPKPKPTPKPEPTGGGKTIKEEEEMQPRSVPKPVISTPEREIVAPVMRREKEPVKEKNIGMGSILRYPSQSLLARIKRKFTGEPNKKYWVDKEGVKRYPDLEENSAKEVREKKMLKEDLNPKDSDDKATLDRVDTYYKTSSKK